MPRTKNPLTNIEALHQVETATERVISTVRSVLQKYPQNTLQPALVPFLRRYADRSIRRSTKGSDVVLGFSSYFNKNEMLRFPVELLDAPEQVITRWARDQYWSAIRASKSQARIEAQRKADQTAQLLKKAQTDHEAALQKLAAASASGVKKRQK